jgi:hypothetical protein
MPNRITRRRPLNLKGTTLLVFLGVTVPSDALAEVLAGCGKGTSLDLDVAPRDGDADLVADLRQRLFSEVSAGEVSPCGSHPAPRISVKVIWPAQDQVRVSVRVRTENKDYESTRIMGLERFPDDGRALAIGIIADEMVDELQARASVEPVSIEPARHPTSGRYNPKILEVRSTSSWTTAFGAAIQLVHFTSGFTLVGPELRMLMPCGPSGFGIGGSLGLGAASQNSVGPDELSFRAVPSPSLSVRFGSDLKDDVGISGVANVQALFLTTAHRGLSAPVASLGIVADLGMSFWQSLGPGLRASLDAHIGRPLNTLVVRGASGNSYELTDGASLGASLGVLGTY